MPRRDAFAKLPESVRAAALVEDNGEVCWPLDRARTAIEAIASGRGVILGLDLREVHEDGSFVEIAWSTYELVGDGDVEASLAVALAALDRPGVEDFQLVLVTW